MQDDTSKPATQPPQLSTRRARKKARTRAEIFEAAMQLFEAEGFEAVTIAKICSMADVARATFFLHYASKSALLVELDRRLATELRARLGSPRGRAASEYRMAADLLGERWPRQPGVLGALLRQVLEGGGELAPRQSQGQDLRDVVEEIVSRGQERGELRRNVSPRLAATMFLAASAAIRSGAVYARGDATSVEIRNQLLHAVLHGLLESKPRLKWRRPGEAGTRDAKS